MKLGISDLRRREFAQFVTVAKTKAQISCAVTAQLICVFVFAYAAQLFGMSFAR